MNLKLILLSSLILVGMLSGTQSNSVLAALDEAQADATVERLKDLPKKFQMSKLKDFANAWRNAFITSVKQLNDSLEEKKPLEEDWDKMCPLKYAFNLLYRTDNKNLIACFAKEIGDYLKQPMTSSSDEQNLKERQKKFKEAMSEAYRLGSNYEKSAER